MIPDLLSTNFLYPFVAHKLNYVSAIRALVGMPRRLLLIGQRDEVAVPASVPLGTVIREVNNEANALSLLGEGSMLMAMWRGARANAELGLPIDILALPAASTATAAAGSITVAGTATVPGEAMVYIAGTRISVGVAVGDTAAAVATKLQAAIAAVPSLPVAATVTGAVITLTCKWKGQTGNDIDVRFNYYWDDVPAQGITLTLAALSGGTTNPSMATYATAVAGYRPTEIALAFTDSTSMATIEAEQEIRWACDNMQDGQVIVTVRANLAGHLTWLAPRNSKQIHSLHTYRDRTAPWVTSAMAGAVIESSAARSAQYPYTGMKLKGYLGASAQDAWSYQDANAIMLSHGSVVSLEEDGTGTLLRMFNHYRRNALGGTDLAARDLCWVKTSSYFRWFRVMQWKQKISEGWAMAEYVTDIIPGQRIMTKELAQEITLAQYQVFMDAGLMQNFPHYQKTLLVELDATNAKVKVMDEPVLITQLYQVEITSNVLAGRV